MSRPFRLVLSAVFLAGALGFSGCVGTLYDETYSYHKNHFKPPQEKKEVSAEAILGSIPTSTAPGAADAGGLPPAGDVPGLPPPAGLPDAAPAAPAPAVPPPAN